MRLIDADALKENLKLPEESGRMGELLGIVIDAVIEDAPTVKECKTGKWIVTAEFEDCRYAKCNQCKVTQIFYYNKPLTNFCPECGADMREQP